MRWEVSFTTCNYSLSSCYTWSFKDCHPFYPTGASIITHDSRSIGKKLETLKANFCDLAFLFYFPKIQYIRRCIEAVRK